MPQTVITETIFGPQKVHFELHEEHVVVAVDGYTPLSPIEIPWDKVEDMERLAAVFGEYKVCEFRYIVEGLGKAYRLKDML